MASATPSARRPSNKRPSRHGAGETSGWRSDRSWWRWLSLSALVLVKVSGGGSGSTSGVASPPAGTPVPEATMSRLASIPLSTLKAAPTSQVATPEAIHDKTLTADGKPELLYYRSGVLPHLRRGAVGALRCPLQIRHVQPRTGEDPLCGPRRRHPDVDVLQDDLHQPILDVRARGDRNQQS